MRSAKTVKVNSRTQFFTPATMEREFMRMKEFASLGMIVASD
jgi:hypothetical protein